MVRRLVQGFDYDGDDKIDRVDMDGCKIWWR